jgi:hypothetical protein
MKCGIRLGHVQTYYRATEQPYKFIIQPINTLLQGIIAKKFKRQQLLQIKAKEKQISCKSIADSFAGPNKKIRRRFFYGFLLFFTDS